MDFEQFKENLAADVKEQIYERFGSEVAVETHTTEKLNASYEALTVKPEDGNVGVNLNANQLFDELKSGNRSYEEIVDKSVTIAWNALDNRPDFNLDALTDYSQMKDKLWPYVKI